MRRFSVAAGFEYENAVSTNYAHGAQLYRAEQKDVGRGIMRENVSIFCDGLFTDEQRVPIISFHADCVPLFFYDPVRRAVAICHAGWRGTSQHITRNAIKSLQSIGCQPENILAAVGPCIGVQHYEVGPEVVDVFRHEFGETTVQQRDDHWYADLTVACTLDMLRSGIIPEHITISGLCTYEDATLFYSHRRDSGRTGAMASVIELI